MSRMWPTNSNPFEIERQIKSELPWPSAFWALVGVAFTPMTQPTGKVLGYPSSWNFALRCSPLLCAFSALDSIIQVCVYTIDRRSLRRGLHRFRLSRFGNEEGEEDPDFAALIKSAPARTMVFVFATVPGAIKIFATQGIPITQACCASYLATYVADEILLGLASKVRHNSLQAAHSAPRGLLEPFISMALRYHVYDLIVNVMLLSSTMLFFGLPAVYTLRDQEIWFAYSVFTIMHTILIAWWAFLLTVQVCLHLVGVHNTTKDTIILATLGPLPILITSYVPRFDFWPEGIAGWLMWMTLMYVNWSIIALTYFSYQSSYTRQALALAFISTHTGSAWLY